MTRQVFTGARIHDGSAVHDDLALVVEDGTVTAVLPASVAPPATSRLAGGILAPGFVDLQVNGGGGRMIDGRPGSIAHVCAAHARLGATALLPTLITDTPETTAEVLAQGIAAARDGVAGFAGLHLEGPHLDPRRKGAHDPTLIRPMTADDLGMLTAAAGHLPVLMVTLAPCAATPGQIAALARAGVVVSLGHAECTAAEAAAAFAAGAACVTHLFNAMSPLTSREPGLVGAALEAPVAAGLIADTLHVAPLTMRVALASKRAPGLFLVSDAMAVAGSDLAAFTLGGRTILRRDGRLTLADGTLAGADLTLAEAVRVMVTQAGVPLATALAMATSRPAAVIGAGDRLGQLREGCRADMVLLDDDLRLRRVWRAGAVVEGSEA